VTDGARQGPTEPVVSASFDRTGIAALELLDHGRVDWGRVRRTAYLVHQQWRYEYPSTIYNLNHRLVVVPPTLYDDQRRVLYSLEVSGADYTLGEHVDPFGNLVLTVQAPEVRDAIDFEVWIVAERRVSAHPHLAGATPLDAYLLPSRLVSWDDALRRTAAEIAPDDMPPPALAAAMNDWVHQRMSYAFGVTDVKTTAADALALGRGLCQDYAHVMIALCRLRGLHARYVSGHLLAEGGTHAWVEVLLPRADGTGTTEVLAFDPTNGCRTGLNYLTVAVGRDYDDVAPTSGTYSASVSGRLSSRKRVGLTEIDYLGMGV